MCKDLGLEKEWSLLQKCIAAENGDLNQVSCYALRITAFFVKNRLYEKLYMLVDNNFSLPG